MQNQKKQYFCIRYCVVNVFFITSVHLTNIMKGNRFCEKREKGNIKTRNILNVKSFQTCVLVRVKLGNQSELLLYKVKIVSTYLFIFILPRYSTTMYTFIVFLGLVVISSAYGEYCLMLFYLPAYALKM